MEIYLLIEGQQQGPYSEEQIRQSHLDRLIPTNVPAWKEGLSEWVPLNGIVNLNPDFESVNGLKSKNSFPTIPQAKANWFFRKNLVLGAVILGGLIAFGLSIGVGFAIVNKQAAQIELDSNKSESTKLPEKVMSRPEWYITVIVKHMQEEDLGINASDVHYGIKKTEDSSMPLICEIDYSIKASTGTDGRGLVPSALPFTFKAFLGFKGNGWKLIQVTDSDNTPLPDGSDMAHFFRGETGYAQPVLHYSEP